MRILILTILILSIMVISGCRGRGHIKLLEENDMITEFKDSSFIFNGKNLEGWEITNFGPQGPVYVSGGNVILGMGEGCTGITYKNKFPEINYQVTLEAKKVAGNDFFCGMTFPVGKDTCPGPNLRTWRHNYNKRGNGICNVVARQYYNNRFG